MLIIIYKAATQELNIYLTNWTIISHNSFVNVTSNFLFVYDHYYLMN
jgi:hypothetical protein